MDQVPEDFECPGLDFYFMVLKNHWKVLNKEKWHNSNVLEILPSGFAQFSFRIAGIGWQVRRSIKSEASKADTCPAYG